MPQAFDHIAWHLQVRAANAVALDKVIRHFSDKAGVRVRRVDREEHDWKTGNLHDVRLHSPLGETDPARAVFRVLLMCREVASGWQVNGPIPYADGQWLFGVLAAAPQAQFSVTGIEWAHGEVRNFPLVGR